MIAALILALALDAPAPSPSPTPKPKPTPIPSPVVVPPEPLPEPSPVPEPNPTPALSAILVPVAPSPASLVEQANSEGFHVQTEIGAMTVTTSDTGTGLTPMISAAAEGPIAIGNGFSLGRLLARIGLTGTPGQTIDGTSAANFKGVEIGLGVGRVIGVMGSVRTSVVGEYDFTTLIKGSDQVRPLHGLVHSAGIGLSFDVRDSSAGVTVLLGFDEATTRCRPPINCLGIHSGFATMIYGQVPILDGKMLFGGDVSITPSVSASGVTRDNIERVFVVVDPVALFKR